MKTTYVAVPLIAMVLVFSSYGIFQYQMIQAQNSKQELIYENTILKDKVAALQTALNSTTSLNGSRLAPAFSARVAFYVGTKDSSANQDWINKGFIPNCLISCNGITYYKDPTTLITNEGLDWIQFELVHVCTVNICTIPELNGGTIEGLSYASTPGALVTDTFGGTGVCSYNGGLITNPNLNSVSDVQGVASGGVAAAGSITWTISYTWTYTQGIASINSGCLLSAIDTSLSVRIIAEISAIGPITLNSADTILEVWSITAT